MSYLNTPFLMQIFICPSPLWGKKLQIWWINKTKCDGATLFCPQRGQKLAEICIKNGVLHVKELNEDGGRLNNRIENCQFRMHRIAHQLTVFFTTTPRNAHFLSFLVNVNFILQNLTIFVCVQSWTVHLFLFENFVQSRNEQLITDLKCKS